MAKKKRTNEPLLFGGDWTQDKLTSLQQYLRAYCQIFKPGTRGAFFRTTYVDAFAGTGYMQKRDMPLAEFFPEEFADVVVSAEEYSKGSAVRALEVEPGFDEYILIERDPASAANLAELQKRFGHKRIEIVNADANTVLQRWCNDTDWSKNRAVVFVDPFGMQVEWTTIESIAKTRAVDFWLLFPIFAVNRMLERHGKMPESWRARLTSSFGTTDWGKEFYRTTRSTLFEGHEHVEKTASLKKIGDYFVRRLKGIFAAVADPLVLRNSKGMPLFLFCFAAANQKGAPTALRIAQHIIDRI